MSLTLLSRPTAISQWVAAKNPLVYSLQRKDYLVSTLNNAPVPFAGRVRTIITGVNATADFKAGDVVYINSAVYSGVFTVFVNATFTAGNTEIIMSEAYTTTDSGGGFINTPRHTGYYVLVKVFNPSNVQIGPAIECFDSPVGIVSADVSSRIRSAIKAEWAHISLVPTPEVSTWTGFYITYQEFWIGSSTSPTTDGSTFYGVHAAKQVLDLFTPGVNYKTNDCSLFRYEFSLSPAELPKWLTRFTRLKYWPGQDYTFSFINTPTLNSGTVNLVQSRFNAAGGAISNFVSSLSDGQNRLTRMAIQDPPAGTAVIKLELLAGSTPITEAIYMDVQCPQKNPVNIFWKNSLGGDSFWCFDYNQEIEIAGVSKRMVLYAENVTTDEWLALNEMCTNGQIYKNPILKLGTDTTRTDTRDGQQVYMVIDQVPIGVIANRISQTIRTRDEKHQFVVEIILPDFFE